VAVAEYEEVKAEYYLERACLSQMVKLESTLHDSRPLVQEVTTKLGIFANVWAAVRLSNLCSGKGSMLTGIYVSDHGRHTKTEELPSPCGRFLVAGGGIGHSA